MLLDAAGQFSAFNVTTGVLHRNVSGLAFSMDSTCILKQRFTFYSGLWPIQGAKYSP